MCVRVAAGRGHGRMRWRLRAAVAGRNAGAAVAASGSHLPAHKLWQGVQLFLWPANAARVVPLVAGAVAAQERLLRLARS